MQGEIDLTELKTFFQSGREISFQKGELILRANEDSRGVYLIKSGILKIYALSRHNDQHIHHFFGPGDFFPMTWIFEDISRNLYYECVEPVVVSLVSKDNFSDFVLSNDKLILDILEEMVLRYMRYSGRIENLLYSNAQERCAYRLLSLGNRFGVMNDNGLEINASITHEDLARSLNMTRETFSRTLKRFQAKKLVGYAPNRHLVINDLGALAKIIGQDEVESTWPKLLRYLTEAS